MCLDHSLVIALHCRFQTETVGSGDGDEDDDAMPIRHNDCALGVPNIGMREGSADSPHLPLLCLEQVAAPFTLLEILFLGIEMSPL